MNSENKSLIFNGALNILTLSPESGTWPNREWTITSLIFDDNLDSRGFVANAQPGDIFIDSSRNRFEFVSFTGPTGSDMTIIREAPWADVIANSPITPDYVSPEVGVGLFARQTPNCDLYQHGRQNLGIPEQIVEYLSQKANYQIEEELCGTGPTGRSRFAQNILGSTSAIAPFDGQTGGIPGDRPDPIQGDEWINPVTDERYVFNGTAWQKTAGPFGGGLSTVSETGNVFVHNGDPDDTGTPLVSWDTPFRFDPENSGSSRIVPANGTGNIVDGNNSSILAGTDNMVGSTGSKSAILAGMTNTVNGSNSAVLAGMGNTIDTVTSIIGNAPVDATGPITITGDGTADNSVILAGENNTVIHDNSVVMGLDYQSHGDNTMNIGGCAYIKDVPIVDISSFIGTTGSTGDANNICNLISTCSISNLGDVNTTGVTVGKYLRYNGTEWVDEEITNISSDSFTVSGDKSAVMATNGCTVSGIESAIIGSDSCITTTDNTVILGSTGVTHNVANSAYVDILYTSSGTVLTSDEREKKDINQIVVDDVDQYLEKITATKTYSFRLNKDDNHAPLRHGFIAQRLLETFPHTVKTDWRKPYKVTRTSESEPWIAVESGIQITENDHIEVDSNNSKSGIFYRDQPLDHYSLDPIQIQQVSWVAIQQLIEKNKKLTELCQNLDQRLKNLE